MTELLIAFFFLSILANAIFIWYLRENTTRLIFISKNIGHLLDIVLEYREHLKTISELELFYGDENIINLIKHTKFMVEEIDKFKEIYSITEEEVTPEDATDQEEERQKEKEE